MKSSLVKQILLVSGSIFLAASSAFAHNRAMKSVSHATIVFEEGSSILSKSDKAILKSITLDAEEMGKINEVKVVAWSDKKMPESDKNLLPYDHDLAQRRADAISGYLQSETSVNNVTKFNMGENANWIARNFNTQDSELKSIFSKKGASSPVTNKEFRLIKRDGGPSSAVVVIDSK